MTLKYAPDSRAETALPDGGPPARLSGPRQPTFAWIITGLVVLVGLAGFIWWLLDSTVPVGEYEAATASLSAVEAELTDVSAENTSLGNEVAALSGEIKRLEDELADLSEQTQNLEQGLGSLVNVARAIALDRLAWDPEFIAELRSAGLDESVADQLMVDLQINGTFAEWVESDNWQTVNRIMMQVPDERVQDAWDAYADSEIDSLEEAIAWMEFNWRLVQLLVEPLLELEATTLSG
jgi:hypothetical protein